MNHVVWCNPPIKVQQYTAIQSCNCKGRVFICGSLIVCRGIWRFLTSDCTSPPANEDLWLWPIVKSIVTYYDCSSPATNLFSVSFQSAEKLLHVVICGKLTAWLLISTDLGVLGARFLSIEHDYFISVYVFYVQGLYSTWIRFISMAWWLYILTFSSLCC